MALLVSSPVENAQAAPDTVALAVLTGGTPANSTAQSITVTDTDIMAGSFLIVTIDPASSGSAQFTSGGGQALVCIESAACDTNADETAITVNLTGTGTVGTVVVHVRLVGAGVDDSDIVTVAYTQNAIATTLTLYAGNAATGVDANGTSIPATPALVADQVVLAARITTASGAVITPTAGSTVFFSAQASGTGIFNDSQADAGTMPLAWQTAAGEGLTAYGTAPDPDMEGDEGLGNSGCAPGATGNAEGQQACTGTTDTVDDGEISEVSATAAVIFEGAGIAGDVTIIAVSGGLTSNAITLTLFGPAANVTVAPPAGAACLQGGGTPVNGDCSRVSNAAGAFTTVTITVTDALGFPLAGFTPAARIAGAPADALGIAGVAATGAAGTTAGTLTVPVGGSAEGTQTVEVSMLGGVAFVTLDSTDIELVGAIAAIAFTTQTPDGPIPNLGTVAVAFHCTTAGGLDCLAASGIGIGVTGAGIIALPAGAVVAAGVITVNVVVEDQTGNTVLVRVTNLAGTVIGTHMVIVHMVIVTGDAGGTFAPPIAATGQTFTVYSGGSVAGLITSLGGATATSGTANNPLAAGTTVTVIVTTLAFVNADFNAAFPGGVPTGTILAVRAAAP